MEKMQNGSIRQFLSTNLTFFRKVEQDFLSDHRHEDQKIQQEYDKRFGLTVKR